MNTEFTWLKPIKTISEETTGGKDALLFLANTARRFMDPYVPAQDLVLAQNVKVYVEDNNGIVEYNSPYAHYQFIGEIYGPNFPIVENGSIVGWRSPAHKSGTGRSMKHSTFRHPLATSHWDQAMMTARKGDLEKAMQNYINGGRI